MHMLIQGKYVLYFITLIKKILTVLLRAGPSEIWDRHV